MSKIIPLFLALLVILAGCSQDLHFKIHYGHVDGLAIGDPLTLNDRQVGQVTAIDTAKEGGYLVSVTVDRESISAATSESNFYLVDNPQDTARKRIDIVQARPDGKPLAEGAVVEGSYPGPLGPLPFGAILKEFGNALWDLRGQVERFRQELEKVPNSEEARKLEEAWRQLMKEMLEAQNAAEGSLKKDLLPKLQEELENLKKKLQELEQGGRKKPLET
jgi:hypothetical protein